MWISRSYYGYQTSSYSYQIQIDSEVVCFLNEDVEIVWKVVRFLNENIVVVRWLTKRTFFPVIGGHRSQPCIVSRHRPLTSRGGPRVAGIGVCWGLSTNKGGFLGFLSPRRRSTWCMASLIWSECRVSEGSTNKLHGEPHAWILLDRMWFIWVSPYFWT
jgi:hypothetical protein